MASKNFETVKSKLNLGIFISRTLWSWPSCLEEVIPSVMSREILLTPSFKMTLKSCHPHPVSVHKAPHLLEVHLKRRARG
jgi:hypothetical protein